MHEERVLARIEDLKVPPAWEDARIAGSPSAKVQAIGYDSAGRLQYRYHDKYRERKEREKVERILDFADRFPEMRRVTGGHLRHERLDREISPRLHDAHDERRVRQGRRRTLREERYAKNNKTYGIATLRRKHLRIAGDTLVFECTSA